MTFNLYKPGKRGPETLAATAPDFATALRILEADSDIWSIVPAERTPELEGLDSFVPRYGLGSRGTGIYCLFAGEGISTMGYAYAASQAALVADWLAAERGLPDSPYGPQPGTPEAYAHYRAVMAAGAAHSRESGRKCLANLTPQLMGLNGKQVEVTDPDGEIRRFRVGQSTGWLPIHLEIEGRSAGGMGASDSYRSVRVIGK